MSTEQPLDPHLIEQTKQQIRGLVAEIAQLSKSDIAPQEFYAEFLTRVVSALAAIGGAVWTTEEEGRLTLQYKINIEQTGLAESEEAQKRHSRLLYKVLADGEAVLVPPQSGAGDDEEAGNPTNMLLVLGPLATDLETVGVVEVFQRPEAAIGTQKGYLRFLMQMCDLAADFVKSRQLRHFTDRQILWTQLEEFTRVAHVSLDPRQAAYIIANEGRRLIECDRLSVAIRKGNKCHIEAVSGQDMFDKRSNTVRLLGKLASAVVATGESVWYSGDTSDMAPQVEDAVEEYVDESHSKAVAVLPLQRPPSEAEDEPDKQEEPEAPIGALIVEQIEDSRVPETMLQRVDVVSRHSATALANALEHQNLFLMPVWRALGKTKWVFRARTLPKTISIAVAVLLLLLGLIFWPADFELKAKGTLEPVERSDVFARIDGVVKKLDVKHGDAVDKGTLLAELRNTDLDVAIADILGQRKTTHEQMLSIQRSLLSSEKRMSVEERNRMQGELSALRQKKESLDAQWQLYRMKKEDLNVTSPRRGHIITWDLYDRLIHRPVQRGQVLMRVADPTGPWQLELQMPEDRMGYIVQAQNDKKLGKNLDVTYILATNPDLDLKGRIKEIHLGAEVRGEEGNTVLIKVEIDKADLPHAPRAGATVTAKVYCGRRPIGYVWFHDLLAFIHSKILFRL